MTPARRRQVEEIYRAASQREESQREAFLNEACEGDEELKSEVESQLRQASSGEGLLAWGDAPREARESSTQLKPGDELGRYRIVSLIGSGGMGEVYKAHDPRAGRDVAIKVSAARFTDRFEREARAIAALNHPNICQLYDVGPNYLVMELVEGPTLADRIRRGAVPLDEVLEIASQVAGALDAAHSRGVVHRDLKPANLKLTPDGAVKVLDFGLAKAIAVPAPGGAPLPTETLEPSTQAGMILGTAAYMSPEQAQGKPLDKRTDVWSFAVVIYEMLTGKRAFDGKSIPHIIVHVLEQEPDWAALPAGTPPNIRELLERCLRKDSADRPRDIGDLRLQLQEIAKQPGSVKKPAHVSALRQRGRWIWPAIAAAVAVIAAVTAWELLSRPVTPARATRFQVALPEGVAFSQYLSVSPDGHKLVFNSTTGQQGGLWIHDLDSLDWRKLPGTEGARAPFWSPDSRFIAFSVGNELKKIEVAGGPPQTLCTTTVPPGSGAWNQNGVIVFGAFGGAAGPIRRVSAAGGLPADVTALDKTRGESYHARPAFLPDGKHFLYFRAGAADVMGIYAGSLAVKPAEQSRERILAETTFGTSYASGNLFFMRENTLMVQPFDPGKLQLGGEPVPVAEHVAIIGLGGTFSASAAGVLAWVTGPSTDVQLTWFDRQGKAIGSFGETTSGCCLALSPDGTQAVIRDALLNVPGDILRLDFTRGVRTRLTFRQSPGSTPVWSPDGSRIVFSASTSNSFAADALYEKASSGAGEEKELLKVKNPGVVTPTSWSRDGRFLLYHTNTSPGTGADLWLLPLQGDREPVLLLGTRFNEFGGTFSPDGKWIAYASNESGRSEIYIRPFVSSGSSGPHLGEGKWQLSRDGGSQPKWRSDGKEIIFSGPVGPSSAGTPMAVDVDGIGAAFQMGVPRKLFTSPAHRSSDVTADGKRFLMLVYSTAAQQNGQTPITVVLNWAADLRR